MEGLKRLLMQQERMAYYSKQLHITYSCRRNN
jgi:hypothetical protein